MCGPCLYQLCASTFKLFMLRKTKKKMYACMGGNLSWIIRFHFTVRFSVLFSSFNHWGNETSWWYALLSSTDLERGRLLNSLLCFTCSCWIVPNQNENSQVYYELLVEIEGSQIWILNKKPCRSKQFNQNIKIVGSLFPIVLTLSLSIFPLKLSTSCRAGRLANIY